MKINWIITDHNITINYDGQTHIVSKTDTLATRLIEAIKSGKLDEIPSLVSVAKRVEKFSDGNFVVKDGQILINGTVAPRILGEKILKFSQEGLPYQPLLKFAENLQKNPSYRAVNELFSFLEKNNHPITENGNFIAYKKVRSDFKDIYTGTIDNSVGKIISMPRNQVNEDPNQTCSAGLHVANWDYAANHYGNKETDIMLEVEVNPANVVCVPIDYNGGKLRTSEYKVLGVAKSELSSNVYLRQTNVNLSSSAANCNDEDEYPWEDEFED